MVNVYTRLYSRESDNAKANKDTGMALTALGLNRIHNFITTHLTCRVPLINDCTNYMFGLWHEDDNYTKLDHGGLI